MKSVYSMMAVVQIISFVCKMETGKNGVGNEQERGRERRENQIKRVGDGV